MEEKDGIEKTLKKLATYVPNEGEEMKYLYDVSDIMTYRDNFPSSDSEEVITAMVNKAIK